MHLFVRVKNAEWREGCIDTPDHKHPPMFHAVVAIDGYDAMRESEQTDAIQEALESQCDRCIVRADIAVLEAVEDEVWYERREACELEEED